MYAVRKKLRRIKKYHLKIKSLKITTKRNNKIHLLVQFKFHSSAEGSIIQCLAGFLNQRKCVM